MKKSIFLVSLAASIALLFAPLIATNWHRNTILNYIESTPAGTPLGEAIYYSKELINTDHDISDYGLHFESSYLFGKISCSLEFIKSSYTGTWGCSYYGLYRFDFGKGI